MKACCTTKQWLPEKVSSKTLQFQYGDELNHVVAGTPFGAIANYNCPTCEAPKEDFMPVEMELSAMVKP